MFVGHIGESCRTQEPIVMLFAVWTLVCQVKHVLDRARVPHRKGHCFGEGRHTWTCPDVDILHVLNVIR